MPGGESAFTTYLSCELAVRADQVPAACGRYELLAICDDEAWVRSTLTDIGQMSLGVAFDHGHTLDIGPWVAVDAPIQAVLFEELARTSIDSVSYGVLQVIGLHRSELARAREQGAGAVVDRLKAAGVYPRTSFSRPSCC